MEELIEPFNFYHAASNGAERVTPNDQPPRSSSRIYLSFGRRGIGPVLAWRCDRTGR